MLYYGQEVKRMDKQTEIKVARLQDALPSLRKTAGWSAERLGQELDVTRQTIVNLETGKAKMTKVQYLAIRSVFDTEAKASGKETLLNLLVVMVDQDTPEKSRKELKDTIDTATKAVGRRSGATAAGAAALTAAAAAPGWKFPS